MENDSKTQDDPLMDKVLESIQQYVRSGKYFDDAKVWYIQKYLHPIVYRSMTMIFCCIFVVFFACMAINLNSLLPLEKKVQYSIKTSDAYRTEANIIRANHIKDDPQGSVTDIMLKNYILHREGYDYDKLKDQVKFIQNSSSKIVFRKFYNFINIDNPISPIMRYQKYIRRSVKILSVKYNNQNDAIVRFESFAKGIGGELIENMIWEANINFEIDQIDLTLPNESRFNFNVTNYSVKLISDKIKK